MRAVLLVVMLCSCGISTDYGGTSYRCEDGVCPAGQTCVNQLCVAEAPSPDAPVAPPVDGPVTPPDAAVPLPDAPPAFSPPWWDAEFTIRQHVSITNDASTQLLAGFQVRWLVNMNGGDLAIDVSDQDTFRVLHWDGATWSQLNRIIDDNAASQEVIWIRLVDPIAAGDTDDSYWFYYGAPTTIAPPSVSSSAMWDFYDGFNGSTLDPQWNADPTGTTVQLLSGQAVLEPGESLRSDYEIGMNEAFDFEIEVANTSTRWWGGLQDAGTFAPEQPWAIWITRAENVGNIWPELQADAAGVTAPLLGPTETLPVNAEHMYTVIRQPGRVVWEYDAIETHWEDISPGWAEPMNLRFTNDTTATNVLVGFARTRQYVRPFPTGALLEVEMLP